MYFIKFLSDLVGKKFNLKDVSYAELSTFPIFFGQLTGAYEGIGTVSAEFLLSKTFFQQKTYTFYFVVELNLIMFLLLKIYNNFVISVFDT